MTDRYVAERGGGNVDMNERYVTERGNGNHGTAYNKRDWEVIDTERKAGNRIVCRATGSDARLVMAALNMFEAVTSGSIKKRAHTSPVGGVTVAKVEFAT